MRKLCVLAVIAFVASLTNKAAADRCNVAMCIGSTDTVDETEYNTLKVETVNYLRTVYSRFARSTFALAIYSDDVLLRHRCYPKGNDRDIEQEDCVGDKFRTVSRSAGTQNNVAMCMESICNHNQYYKYTMLNKQYDLVLVTDQKSSDPVKAKEWADRCMYKGFVINCVIIDSELTETKEYDEYCDRIERIPSYTAGNLKNALARLSVNMGEDAPVKPLEVCNNHQGDANKLAAHPHLCESFVSCEMKNGAITSLTKQCGCSMFWDPTPGIERCSDAASMFCKHDTCRVYTGVTTYPFIGNCRSYWVCKNGRTDKTMCCNKDERYDTELLQCVPDPGKLCDEECPCVAEVIPDNGCKNRPNPNNPHSFFQNLQDTTEVEYFCPWGAKYDEKKCGCEELIHVGDEGEDDSCPMDFHVTYTNNKIKDEANSAWIKTRRVKVTSENPAGSNNGYGNFGGNSYCLVPRFSHYDWRNNFCICTKFNTNGNVNNDGPLMSNGGCGEDRTFEMRLDRDSGGNPVVVCEVVTDFNGETLKLQANYRTGEENFVAMTFSQDGVFSLKVTYADGTAAKDSIRGQGNKVLPNGCSLYIGYGGNRRYYSGYMLDNRVYIDCIPRDSV